MNIDIGAVSGVLLTPCVCPICGAVYAIPTLTYESRRKNGGDWYCPNGHSVGFAKSRADELEERVSELAREKQDLEKNRKELLKELNNAQQKVFDHEKRIATLEKKVTKKPKQEKPEV